MNTTYENFQTNYSVADAIPAERAAFIRKTYLHLVGALALFGLLEFYLVYSGTGKDIAITMLSHSWAFTLIAFIGVSWLATWWANSQKSTPLQYMGLVLYIVAQGIIFLPLLFLAAMYSDGYTMIAQAGVVTVGLFLGLTAVVFLTKKDFSFLGPILMVASFVALAAIFGGIFFGFGLGTLFSFAMVAIAGGSILYQTSNILHQYNPNQHVAASLALFASIALLFWYILQIFMGGSRD